MITDCMATTGPRIHRTADTLSTLCGKVFGGVTNGYPGPPCTDCAAAETALVDKPEPTGAARVTERQNRLRGIVAGEAGVMNPALMAMLDECMADAMSAAYDDGYADARAMFDTEG